jgi:hypothetical protein
VLIDPRFNGPPDSAHGGVACGIFAAAIDSRTATVRLLAPPPLSERLDVVAFPDGSRSVEGPSGAVATVRSWAMPGDLEPLRLLTAVELGQGKADWMTQMAPSHPFPTCFGCGHGRTAGDCLELFPGAIPGTELCGATWTPSDGTAGDVVDDWMVWAAVDCPSGAATMQGIERGTAILLAELSLNILDRPLVGTEYQVVARPLSRDRRKLHSDVALVAPDGTNVARGRALWIVKGP